MSLLELQREFRSAVLNRSSGIEARLAGRCEIGLAVYRNAYRLRLRDCLRETYEKTWAWLGDARFDAAVGRYVDANRPRSWTLADYGEGFADALAVDLPDDPEASELAWLDWAMRRAFDGASALPLQAAQHASIDWDNSVLRFAPTLALRAIATNCGAIWAAISDGKTPPEAEMLPAPAALCVWRKDLSPRFRTIEGGELLALRLARAGVPFGEICRLVALGRSDADVVAGLGRLLARWLEDEMLVAPLNEATQESFGPR